MSKEVLIITEGGKKNGFGHLARCVAIYQALKVRRFCPRLIVKGDSSVVEFLKGKNYERFDWERNKVRLLSLLKGKDIVIVDSYLADKDFYSQISCFARMPVYIDDNKRIEYPRGIILNNSIYADRLNYSGKNNKRYLLGPEYSLLRKEFWRCRKKTIRQKVSCLMLTLGGNDEKRIMPVILKLLIKNYPFLKKKVIIGKGFNKQYINKLKKARDKNTSLIYYPDAKRMREIMLESDIAISAAGQTLYELASLGTPTVALVVAKNQLNNAKGWQKTGFIDYVGSWENGCLLNNLTQSINRLMPYKRRIEKSLSLRKKINLDGVFNILDSIQKVRTKNKNIELTHAEMEDSYDLWSWRNHPRVRRWCLNNKRINYKDHKRWLSRLFKSGNSITYIANDKILGKIGQIRFDIKKYVLAYVSVNLNPQLLGRGMGSKIIKIGTRVFMKERPEIKTILAEIIDSNIRSKKSFEKAGYRFYCYSSSDQKTALFKFRGR